MGLFKQKFIYINSIVNLFATLALLFHVLNPMAANAQITTVTPDIQAQDLIISETMAGRMLNAKPMDLPDKKVQSVITAYTSTPDQTDDSPFIAATGKRVHDGMIAANWLPFGTIVKIPSLYGDKEFVVEDRMNSRYGYGRLDIWFDSSKSEAFKFGVKRVEVEIYYQAKEVAKK